MRNKIKKLRLLQGMKQKELAVELSVDRTTVTKWELNLANPRTDKIPILAKVLGCKIEDLFETEQTAE